MNTPKHKVLVVDDDPVSLKIMVSALKSDYEVQVSTDAEEAIVVSQEDAPDLLLLDINLKRGDGFQILEALKADRNTAEIPIIFVTNDSCPETEAEAFIKGSNDFIIKPIVAPVLASKAQQAISHRYNPFDPEMEISKETRFLIIDDSQVDLSIAIECFKEELTVITAPTGGLGIEAALEARPALILLDIVLPDFDGYEVLRKLKAAESTRDIPVILTSGEKIRDKHAIQGFEAGAVDHIEKPFHGELLKHRVWEQLRRFKKYSK